jgi:hypothetical protein
MLRTSGVVAGLLALAVSAACGDDGDDGNAQPDASDVTVDAAPEPPGPGTVRITVLINGDPAIARVVAFHNPDGSLLGVEVTDGTGRCRRDDVLPGSMVTVDARPAGSASPALHTVAGLEPGDVAQLGTLSPGPGESIGTLQVSYADIGASGYRHRPGGPVHSAAGPTTSHSGAVIDRTVRLGPVVDYLLVAVDGAVATHEASVTDLAFTPGQTTSVTAPAWTAVPRRTLSFERIPATVSGFVIVEALRGPFVFHSDLFLGGNRDRDRRLIGLRADHPGAYSPPASIRRARPVRSPS